LTTVHTGWLRPDKHARFICLSADFAPISSRCCCRRPPVQWQYRLPSCRSRLPAVPWASSPSVP